MSDAQRQKFAGLFWLALALTVNISVSAETIVIDKSQIINKSWQAVFGDKKNEDIRTIYLEEFDANNKLLNQKYIERPNLIRNVFDEGTLIFDGKRAAYIATKEENSKEKPNKLKTTLVEILEVNTWAHFEVDIAAIFPAFFEYDSKLLGTTKIDGNDSYEIFVKFPLGATVNYFVDKNSYLVVKQIVSWEGNPNHKPWEVTIPEYHNFDGFNFPLLRTSQEIKGLHKVKLKNVKINEFLDSHFFSIKQ